MSTRLPDCQGTYVLLLEACRWTRLTIGKFGQLPLQPGCYLYVGSAHGPGGIRARVGRHLKSGKSLRWHIDYLREWSRPIVIWYTCDSRPLEPIWVDALSEVNGITVPMTGFGASDHSGRTHLYFCRRCPRLREFEERLQQRPGPLPYLQEWQVEA